MNVAFGFLLYGSFLLIQSGFPYPDAEGVSLVDRLLPVFQREALCITRVRIIVTGIVLLRFLCLYCAFLWRGSLLSVSICGSSGMFLLNCIVIRD